MAIAPVSIASATAPDWLKEAQESLIASETPGGLLGALNDARRTPGSVKTFLAQSQNASANLALISQGTAESFFALTAQMASSAADKRIAERQALAEKLNPQQTNYNPPSTIDDFIYFDDGTSIDTVNNIMTKPDGTQIDTVTGQPYVEPGSLIQMANGAYLDTKKNILTMADGTKIDIVTGLTISA